MSGVSDSDWVDLEKHLARRRALDRHAASLESENAKLRDRVEELEGERARERQMCVICGKRPAEWKYPRHFFCGECYETEQLKVRDIKSENERFLERVQELEDRLARAKVAMDHPSLGAMAVIESYKKDLADSERRLQQERSNVELLTKRWEKAHERATSAEAKIQAALDRLLDHRFLRASLRDRAEMLNGIIGGLQSDALKEEK